MEKNNKKIEVLSFIVLVVLIIALAFVLYIRRNSITNVNKVLSNKYDEIKCVDEKCQYLTAYKESNNKVYVYDSYGTKISTFEKSNSRMLYKATPTYLLFKNVSNKGELKNYIMTKTSGKKVYTSENELTVLSDYLVEDKGEETSKIVNYNGKVLYSDIKKVRRFENVSSIKVQNEEYLIDENGNRILSDYVIDKEIKNDNNKVLYLILKDSSNAYYYFDIKAGKISSDSFSSYKEGAKDNGLYIYKKSNGETIKYILTKNGKVKDDPNEPQTKLVKRIEELLSDKYSLYTQSVVSNKQTKVLVDNKEDNSFGTFDINEKKYKKIYNYVKEDGSSIIFNFDSYDDNRYFQISCTEGNCGSSKITVFDVSKGKVLFNYEANENQITKFTGIKDGYSLVKYSANSTDEFKDKYVLYDKKNNIIASSKNLITVVDKKIIFGEKYGDVETIIYSAKLKKVLNSDDSLAMVNKVNKTKIYEYSDDNKTYFVSNKGDILFKVNNEKSNIYYTDEVILNITEKKVSILDAKNNKVGEYKFEDGESIIGEKNSTLSSYKNSIFVNSSNGKYGKIVDYSGKKVKKLKKTNIYSVEYCKKTNSVIIITVDNNKYGFYVAK